VSSVGAIVLGPLVISFERALAALGLVTLLLVAALLSRRWKSPPLNDWAFAAAVVSVLGARAAFVVDNLPWYAARPVEAFAIWQGGFDAWWGVAAAALFSLHRAWRLPELRRGILAAGGSALAVWVLVSAVLTPGTGSGDVVLPEVVLQDLDGSAVALAARDGRPTLLNLWATWCPPCRRELPLLTEVARDRAGEIRVVLVSQGESGAVVRGYLDSLGLDGAAVLLDPRSSLAAALGAVGLPTTLLFDADGTLVHTHVGEISGPALWRLVARAHPDR
jgi:thiol-disulfide isomerase/thioredoxin